MRTTLEIDDDLLAATKALAQQKGVSLSSVISELTRLALTSRGQPKIRNGALLLESRPGAPRPDLNLVNRLRDEE